MNEIIIELTKEYSDHLKAEEVLAKKLLAKKKVLEKYLADNQGTEIEDMGELCIIEDMLNLAGVPGYDFS